MTPGFGDPKSSFSSPSIPEIGQYVSVSFLRTFPVKRFLDSTDLQQRYILFHSGAPPEPGSSAALPLEPDTRLSECISHPKENQTYATRTRIQPIPQSLAPAPLYQLPESFPERQLNKNLLNLQVLNSQPSLESSVCFGSPASSLVRHLKREPPLSKKTSGSFSHELFLLERKVKGRAPISMQTVSS